MTKGYTIPVSLNLLAPKLISIRSKDLKHLAYITENIFVFSAARWSDKLV